MIERWNKKTRDKTRNGRYKNFTMSAIPSSVFCIMHDDVIIANAYLSNHKYTCSFLLVSSQHNTHDNVFNIMGAINVFMDFLLNTYGVKSRFVFNIKTKDKNVSEKEHQHAWIIGDSKTGICLDDVFPPMIYDDEVESIAYTPYKKDLVVPVQFEDILVDDCLQRTVAYRMNELVNTPIHSLAKNPNMYMFGYGKDYVYIALSFSNYNVNDDQLKTSTGKFTIQEINNRLNMIGTLSDRNNTFGIKKYIGRDWGFIPDEVLQIMNNFKNTPERLRRVPGVMGNGKACKL
jgi:hypothetical protein